MLGLNYKSGFTRELKSSDAKEQLEEARFRKGGPQNHLGTENVKVRMAIRTVAAILKTLQPPQILQKNTETWENNVGSS